MGGDLRLFISDWGTDVVIPSEELPLPAVTTDDEFVLTIETVATGTWERYDEDFGELFEDFTVDEAADFVAPADCTVGGTQEDFIVPSTDDGEVHGTVDLPDGAGPFPFVVLVEGTPGAPRDTPVYTCVARRLVDSGYATVRYDDRSYGETPGDPLVDLTLEHRRDDAGAVTAWVADRGDLDLDRLFVYGHSEGAPHALATAAAVPEVDGVVLLAGVGQPFAQESPLQVARLLTNLGYPAEVIEAYREYQASVVAQLLAGTYEGETYGPLSVEYARQLMEQDPVALATAAARPALILQGDRDVLVGPDNADLLAAALEDAGVVDVTVTHYEDMGHLFDPIPEGLASFGEESIGPMDRYAAVFPEILTWLEAH